MKYTGFIWKHKDNNKYLILSERETHIGRKTREDFTDDIECASILSRLPIEISKFYIPIKVEITHNVSLEH